jgi:hypothetical protein
VHRHQGHGSEGYTEREREREREREKERERRIELPFLHENRVGE